MFLTFEKLSNVLLKTKTSFLRPIYGAGTFRFEKVLRSKKKANSVIIKISANNNVLFVVTLRYEPISNSDFQRFVKTVIFFFSSDFAELTNLFCEENVGTGYLCRYVFKQVNSKCFKKKL